jgi:hypothetical protein
LINGPFLFDLKATPAEYSAGLNLTIERGWLEKHDSGTYVKFTQAGPARGFGFRAAFVGTNDEGRRT